MQRFKNKKLILVSLGVFTPLILTNGKVNASSFGAEIFCTMRDGGNDHESSWDAAYTYIKKQKGGLFKVSPKNAAAQITETVIREREKFSYCVEYLDNLHPNRKLIRDLEKEAKLRRKQVKAKKLNLALLEKPLDKINCVVFDIEIIDGSMTDDKVRTMQLAVFTERSSPLSAGEPPMWAFLNQALMENAAQPVSFFRIKGAQDDAGKFSFTTTKHSTIIEAATTKISVQNVGASDYNFTVNGVQANDPTLTLERGKTYEFDVSSIGHPFWIKTNQVTGSSNQYNDGITNNGLSSGKLTFTVPDDAPSTLYYICQICLLYTSPSPRDLSTARMPSSA